MHFRGGGIHFDGVKSSLTCLFRHCEKVVARVWHDRQSSKSWTRFPGHARQMTLVSSVSYMQPSLPKRRRFNDVTRRDLLILAYWHAQELKARFMPWPAISHPRGGSRQAVKARYISLCA